MSLTLFELTEANFSEWDAFVLSHAQGSIHQLSVWKPFQEKIPGRGPVLGFGVKDNTTIKATVLCTKLDTGFLGKSWWYSARGPVFDPETGSDAAAFLITEGAKRLREKGDMFWRFDPYVPSAFKLTEVRTQNAIQQYQPTNTLEIDLTQSDEDILAGMKRKGRYNINLARKKGVTVTRFENGNFGEKDLDDFWRLTSETTSRDRFSGHQKDYYGHFLRELKDYAVLFFAEYEGQRIATAISTFCGNKAIYYFGASTSDKEYRNLMAPYLLQWEMMQYGKTRGCTTYDFLGIAPENEPKHAYAGISDFKWKFGGERRVYALAQEVVLDKLWYNVYRLVKRLKK